MRQPNGASQFREVRRARLKITNKYLFIMISTHAIDKIARSIYFSSAVLFSESLSSIAHASIAQIIPRQRTFRNAVCECAADDERLNERTLRVNAREDSREFCAGKARSCFFKKEIKTSRNASLLARHTSSFCQVERRHFI